MDNCGAADSKAGRGQIHGGNVVGRERRLFEQFHNALAADQLGIGGAELLRDRLDDRPPLAHQVDRALVRHRLQLQRQRLKPGRARNGGIRGWGWDDC